MINNEKENRLLAFVEKVKNLRKVQKTALFKSKFEDDHMEWKRQARQLEAELDAYIERWL